MPPQPLTSSGSIKILVNAPSGWGKTRLLGGSPGGGLILRPPIDYVDSILPAHKPLWQQWVMHDWNESDDVFEHLRHEGKEKYEWVWLDSISGFQDVGLDDLWETIITEKPSRKRYGFDKGDYWINMQRLGRFVRDIATLSNSGAFHFGITAWPAELRPTPEDPEADMKQMPWVQGRNMAMKTCGYVNVVAFGDYTSKGTRVLHFMEDERHYAKDQFDMFPNYKLLNPTMDKIVEAVRKKNPAAADRKPPAKKRAKGGASPRPKAGTGATKTTTVRRGTRVRKSR